MKRIKLPSILALSFIIAGLSFTTQAADAPAATPAAPAAAEAAPKAKPIPYSGTVGAVDKEKQTFTIKDKKGERTFVVTGTTKILNNKQPAKFDDIAADAYVTGSYLKNGDAIDAYSVHLGKTAPVKGSKKSKDATPAPATPEAPKQ
jgi:hypothetical protein